MVSNHDDRRATCEWHGLPYHRLETGAQGEARILDVLSGTGSELLVLARYMQVLSPELVSQLTNRCINIHHSFLPSLKGARPHHQAHARGVKIIGATAHYVTQDLDEGPSIEQAVERVLHRDYPEALVEVGRDLECTVLARAVRWHVERRVLLAGSRMVVFRQGTPAGSGQPRAPPRQLSACRGACGSVASRAGDCRLEAMSDCSALSLPLSHPHRLPSFLRGWTGLPAGGDSARMAR